MAINYNTVFSHLGVLVGRENSYATLAKTTLPADVQNILQVFGTGGTTFGDASLPIEGIQALYQSYQNQAVGWRTGLKPYMDRVLTDYDTVVSQLAGLSQRDITSVMKALIQDMNDNPQSVKGNTVTLGSVAALSGTVGTGTALADKVLDGYSAPLRSGFAHLKFNALNSELAVPSETMVLTCTSDSFTGGSSEGSEQWAWVGSPLFSLFDFHPEGSGPGPSLTTVHGDSTIPGLGFTNYATANTPDSWSIGAGTAGTSVFKEATAAKQFRGAACLRFTGTGAVQPAISQAVPTSALKGRRRYLFTIRAAADGGSPGACNLNILFTSASGGYVAATNEQITVAVGGLPSPSAYGLYSFYWNTPANLPSDLRLSIAITSANLGSNANVYLSSGSFHAADYHGGVNVEIVSGKTPWVAGDRLSFTVTNNANGKFQELMRRAYSCQLPSNLAGNETISDGLAS